MTLVALEKRASTATEQLMGRQRSQQKRCFHKHYRLKWASRNLVRRWTETLDAAMLRCGIKMLQTFLIFCEEN